MKSARYNPPQRMMDKRSWAVALLLVFLFPTARAANWEQPAGELAKQIAALAGPGPARLTIRNDSSLAASEIPGIRRLLERDLRGFGVITGGSESATLIRVTLSENLQGGLWVAEVVEGTETRLTMLPVSLGSTASSAGSGSSLTLRRTLAITETDPVLDAQIFSAGNVQRLVVLEPERIVTYTRSAVGTSFVETAGWVEDQRFAVAHTRPFPRDVRGELVAAQDHLFDAYLPGAMCSGTNTGAQVAVACGDSDDPWPVGAMQRAFYNSMRDSFTGVLAPGFGMEITPFYQASDIPRPTGTGLLLNAVDGRVMLIENSTLKPVSGANDWGSDFAVVRSECGSGVQVLVSGSGAAAAGDSLRAYEIVGREAIAVSASLPVDGAVTAVHAANGGAGATVIVRKDAPLRYEVWNVSAFCN
jgi:hypothetical protein